MGPGGPVRPGRCAEHRGLAERDVQSAVRCHQVLPPQFDTIMGVPGITPVRRHPGLTPMAAALENSSARECRNDAKRTSAQKWSIGWTPGRCPWPSTCCNNQGILRTAGVASRFGQAFAVLSCCRVLWTLQTATVQSKRASANWAKQMLDPAWIGLIDRAWAERDGVRHCLKTRQRAEDVAQRETLAFLRYVAGASSLLQ